VTRPAAARALPAPDPSPHDAARAEAAERLLAPFAPLDRVRPRRIALTKAREEDEKPTVPVPDLAEVLVFAGLSVHGLRRVLKAGQLVCEQAPGGRYFVTLADVARWRASNRNETAAVSPAASEGKHGEHEGRAQGACRQGPG
jgi:hypothetical protein